MNPKWLLAASVLLNLTLAVVLAIRSPGPAPTEPTAKSDRPASPLVHPSPDGRWSKQGVRALKIPNSRQSDATPSNSLEVEDYPEFVRRLRAAGLSEDTIATLVVAEIFFRGVDDLTSLQWQLNTGELTQDEFDAKNRQLQRDNEAALEVLLGKEGFRRFEIEHDFQLKRLAESGAYSSQTIEQYFDLRKAHQQRVRAWEDACRAEGLNPADHGDKKYELEKAYQEEMARVLGADVAARIQADTDWRMQKLRRQMATVEIGDHEYGQINQLTQDFWLERQRLLALQARGDLDSKDVSGQVRSLDQKLKDQIATLLGPERHAEYLKQNDHRYGQMTQFGRTNGLEERQVDHVYQVMRDQWTRQEDFQKQLQARQITREQYNYLVEEQNAATRNSLQRYLGANQYERLKRATGFMP